MFLLGILVLSSFSPVASGNAIDIRTRLVRFARRAALLGTLCGGLLDAGTAAAGAPDYPFRVVASRTDAEYRLLAENNGPAPITVRVDVTGQDFASDRQWPLIATVPAHTTLTLGRVSRGGKSEAPLSARFDYSYHYGRMDAVHDSDAVYRLPFEDGLGVEVTQAYGGRLTSHGDLCDQYAIDFGLAAGSAVLAARDGIVIDVTLRYTEGGLDRRYLEKANSVAILHDDGTVAQYAHLSPGPAVVAAGDRVSTGDLLGYSGSTGYSSNPHLHFGVTRTIVSEGKVVHQAVPVEFYSRDPSMRFSARMGATVWANYAAGLRVAAWRPRRTP